MLVLLPHLQYLLGVEGQRKVKVLVWVSPLSSVGLGLSHNPTSPSKHCRVMFPVQWMTRPGFVHTLGHTVVHKTLSQEVWVSAFSFKCNMWPFCSYSYVGECVWVSPFWQLLCRICCACVLLIWVSLILNSILDLWPYMVSQWQAQLKPLLCLTPQK